MQIEDSPQITSCSYHYERALYSNVQQSAAHEHTKQACMLPCGPHSQWLYMQQAAALACIKGSIDAVEHGISSKETAAQPSMKEPSKNHMAMLWLTTQQKGTQINCNAATTGGLLNRNQSHAMPGSACRRRQGLQQLTQQRNILARCH
jgi:hypothetical protein